jgi:hypothetical protein
MLEQSISGAIRMTDVPPLLSPPHSQLVLTIGAEAVREI